MNEDDKIKAMFSRYNPPLRPDWQFMRRLEPGLDSVEAVRERVEKSRKRSRVAVVVAAVAGFATGAACMALMPQLGSMVADWELTLPAESVLRNVGGLLSAAIWVGVAAAAVSVAVGAFNLTEAVLSRSEH